MQIKWDNCVSQPFFVFIGVRQGGVLSPRLFSAYIDDLSVKLNKITAGCYIGNSLLNHILFADNLCCFSSSLDGLQILVDACSEFAAKNDIIFNCEKSFGVLFAPFGKKFYGTPQLTLNSNKIDFVKSVKYLGVGLHICYSLTDDDIAGQVRSLDCYANMLKHRFLGVQLLLKISFFVLTVGLLLFMLVNFGASFLVNLLIGYV